MIATYIDESYDSQRRVYCVAGYIGNLFDWALELEPNWEKALSEYNLEYFRSAECESGTGQFAQFRDDPSDVRAPLTSDEKARLREVKIKFVDLCVDATIVGVGAVVLTKDFDALTNEDKEAAKLLNGHPYFICQQATMMEAGLLISRVNKARGTHDVLCFVCDQNNEVSGRMKMSFDEFMEKNPESAEYMGSLNYEDKRRFKMLQVADLLAYESAK